MITAEQAAAAEKAGNSSAPTAPPGTSGIVRLYGPEDGNVWKQYDEMVFEKVSYDCDMLC